MARSSRRMLGCKELGQGEMEVQGGAYTKRGNGEMDSVFLSVSTRFF